MLGVRSLKAWLHNKKIKKLHSDHREANLNEYIAIDNVIAKFRESGGLKHDYQSYKLFSLKKLLDSYHPRKILELGSGTTTVVLADWVRNNDGSHLVSVDESEDWLTNSAGLAGIEEGDKRFKLIHAPKVVEYLGEGRVGIKYEIDFADSFDFILIDGPSLIIDGEKRKDAVNTDIFGLIRANSPSVILVDIRVATVDEIKRRFKNYKALVSDLIEQPSGGIGYGYRYFSLFEKVNI